MLSFYSAGLRQIVSLAKKIFLVIATFVVVLSFFFYFINKDKTSIRLTEDPVQKNREEIYKTINDPALKKTKEGPIVIAIYKSTMCALIGEACTSNPKDGDINFPKSIFGTLSRLITTPYANPPASGLYWAYSGLQSSGFVPKSLAAEGLGFSTIKPYADLWKIFRDVSYLILVVILVAIGFMIMFRMKINPQTVITVENAIPRIVVALLLITFSFAIAGFLIDLMYIVILLIVSLLSNNNTYYNSVTFQNEFVMATGFDLFKHAVARGNFWDMTSAWVGALLGIIPYEVQTILKIITGVITVFIVNGIAKGAIIQPISEMLDNIHLGGGALTFNIAASLGKLPSGILGVGLSLFAIMILFVFGMTVAFPLIIFVLIFGTVVFLVLRIFFLLLTSYLKLLFLVIVAPVLLIFEVIPGKSVFASWIKNIIGNLLPFPVIIAVFLIGYIIINSSLPFGTYDIRLPYLYGINANSFKVFIGLGLIFMIPDLIKTLKEAMGIKELPVGLNVGTFFGGAGAVGGGAMGLLGQFSTANLGLQGLTALKGKFLDKKGKDVEKDVKTVGRNQPINTGAGESETPS